jgi:hypothetical protein
MNYILTRLAAYDARHHQGTNGYFLLRLRGNAAPMGHSQRSVSAQ